MSRLCFLIVIAFVNNFVTAQDDEFRSSFIENEIVPDVLSVAPASRMTVQYENKPLLRAGDILTPTEAKDIPVVTWDYDPNKFYTVVKTDPDAPSRRNPKFREWLHWLVVNIPGDDMSAGDTFAEYVGAGPGKNTGLHRYVFLVYEQPYPMSFYEPRITDKLTANRTLFSVKRFAQDYNLGDPIAGNFYEAEYDDYVPILYEKLGLSDASDASDASYASDASSGQRTTLNCNAIVLTAVMMVFTLTV